MERFRLRVGPAVYEVTPVPELETQKGTKLDGQIMHGSEMVYIESGLPIRTYRVTVVHELIHAILQQAGRHKLYRNEGLLDALAYGLVGVQVSPGAVTGQGTPVLQPLFDAIESGEV